MYVSRVQDKYNKDGITRELCHGVTGQYFQIMMYEGWSEISRESAIKSHCSYRLQWQFKDIRRMAENGFAPPPLGNFADISYLVEN